MQDIAAVVVAEAVLAHQDEVAFHPVLIVEGEVMGLHHIPEEVAVALSQIGHLILRHLHLITAVLILVVLLAIIHLLPTPP